jgi:hypothetical protein
VLLQIMEILLLGQPPHKCFLNTPHGYLVEGPCDMRESQHKPTIEIHKAQEASKVNECGLGWPVMDDLDVGWIHMHTMSINEVS